MSWRYWLTSKPAYIILYIYIIIIIIIYVKLGRCIEIVEREWELKSEMKAVIIFQFGTLQLCTDTVTRPAGFRGESGRQDAV